MTAIILPGDHVTVIAKGRHRRVHLLARLHRIDRDFLALGCQGQLTIAELDCLDAAQRVVAVIAVKGIIIRNCPGSCIKPVIRQRS